MTRTYQEYYEELTKGGPFIGPKGGKWADAKHTIPWKDGGGTPPTRGSVSSEKTLKAKYAEVKARNKAANAPKASDMLPKEGVSTEVDNAIEVAVGFSVELDNPEPGAAMFAYHAQHEKDLKKKTLYRELHKLYDALANRDKNFDYQRQSSKVMAAYKPLVDARVYSDIKKSLSSGTAPLLVLRKSL